MVEDRAHNPIHSSSYGSEQRYQSRQNTRPYAEDGRNEQALHAELEDTSGNSDMRSSKTKSKWGMSGLKEKAARAIATTNKPKSTAATSDLPAPLRINKPPNAIELPADETSRQNTHGQDASTIPQIMSPNDPKAVGYIYDKGTNGLIRNPNQQRDFNSFSSTVAQADTSNVSEHDESEEELQPKVPRRSVPMRRASEVEHRDRDISDTGQLELSKITESVLRACLDYPEFRGFDREPTQIAIARILERYGKITAPMRDPSGQVDPNGPSRRDLIQAQDDLRSARTKIADREHEIQKLRHSHGTEVDGLNGQIASLKYQIKELKKTHDTSRRNDLGALQAENGRLKSMYENQLRKERDDANTEKTLLLRQQKEDDRLIEDLNAQVATLTKDVIAWSHDCKRLQDHNAHLEYSINGAKDEEDKRVNDLENRLKRELRNEQQRWEKSLETLQDQIGELERALKNERVHKQAELQKQQEELEQKHNVEKEELRTEVEVFKVAVTQREHFKGLTDSEVANQYKRLANSIEDFARVDWSLSKEEDWPLSDGRMRQLGKNPRKMKHQIIQNTLWMFLYKHVFCSPFRILGATGEEFDEGWAQIYSHGRCRIISFLRSGLS
jgi:hypothetical protein